MMRNFGPFPPRKLFQFINILGLSWLNSPLQVMPQHFSWVKVRTQTWPHQNMNFLLFQPFFSWLTCVLLSLSCCITQTPLSLRSWTVALIFSCKMSSYSFEFIDLSVIVRCPGLQAAKQFQTMMPPAPFFTIGMRFWCWCAVLSFFPKNIALYFFAIEVWFTLINCSSEEQICQ